METEIKAVEGKELVLMSGKCSICNKVITFDVANDMRVSSNQLAVGIYEMFFNNNEVCFECRLKLESWVKAHKEFCNEKSLNYRDIGNQFLKKMGKQPVIGITTVVSEETNEVFNAETEEDNKVSVDEDKVKEEEEFQDEVSQEEIVSPEEELIINELKGGDEK